MYSFLEKLDGKQVAMIITSVGGIILAMGLSFTLYKILNNDLTHLNSSIERQTEVQVSTNLGNIQALGQVSKAIEGNTKILEIIERRIK